MRKTIATFVVLSAILIGYTAWPLYDLFVLVRAIETRGVDTVVRHVYFDQVRISLTNQIVAAYVRPTGVQDSPLARSMAGPCIARSAATHGRDTKQHHWNYLADFWKFRIWLG